MKPVPAWVAYISNAQINSLCHNVCWVYDQFYTFYTSSLPTPSDYHLHPKLWCIVLAFIPQPPKKPLVADLLGNFLLRGASCHTFDLMAMVLTVLKVLNEDLMGFATALMTPWDLFIAPWLVGLFWKHDYFILEVKRITNGVGKRFGSDGIVEGPSKRLGVQSLKRRVLISNRYWKLLQDFILNLDLYDLYFDVPSRVLSPFLEWFQTFEITQEMSFLCAVAGSIYSL